jgi:3-oxoacyl-[acyl-carrier protein] reductase
MRRKTRADSGSRNDVLTGQVALVTGGGRGIGAAISRRLAQRGAHVAINFRTHERVATAVAADLTPLASVWRADVTNRRQAGSMVAGVLRAHGRLDILVLNAGVWQGGPIATLPAAAWKVVLDTALNGAFQLVQAALPAMRDQEYGRIIAITSVIGLIGYPGDTAYATAKAGLNGFIRSLAKEVGRDGITVNAVAPGLIKTDMTAAIPQVSKQQLLRRCAIRRMGSPDEVAGAVEYLVCDGTYVTGQVIVVDGGLSL